MMKNRGSNVVLLPTVVDFYLEQAFVAREEKRFDEAIAWLSNILQFEPEHPVALFDMALTRYESDCYEEARDVAMKMWEEEIGDRSSVLRLYLSCLIRLEDFDGISRLLNEAQNHDGIIVTEDLLEIKAACDLLRQSEEDHDANLSRDTVIQRIADNPDYPSELYEKLDGGTFEEQLRSIEQLKYIHTPETVSVLKEYLLLVYPDPILKTFAVRALKEMGEGGRVFIHKYNQLFEANIEDVPLHDQEIPDEERRVMEIIGRVVDNGDVSFLPFALQLWMEYLFAIFPLHPAVRNTASWAAALHYATARLLHMDLTQKRVAALYQVPLSSVSRNYRSLNQVLEIDS
ncbi:tetratricopeptide repeat protein [Aneurinibacillus terranovensis]|uniref:tetratricopeptide repeat protein n=1 Tax=Aneurinibacillus terranovensis TaxID=278991 RepID=UPI0003FB8492|nr:tetratricopeptide repeat protein [Aneurinibacillus terranovensis]